jgi:hypothetical protein
MYIDKIDDILEEILDTTYEIIDKDKLLKQKSYTNKIIKNVVTKVMEKININKLKELGFEKILEQLQMMFKKFVYLYILITIQKNFKKDEFINFVISFNVIESTIFDSNFNSKILFINTVLDQLDFLIKNMELIQNGTVKINKNDYYHSLQLFDEYDKDVIGNLSDAFNFHNILKLLIFKKIYISDDKVKLYSILEVDELENLEFKFIEIIDSMIEQIDYASVESLFKSKEYKNSFIESIYNILLENEQVTEENIHMTLDSKINELFEKKLIIPITDEFLRYHKESEKYDTGSN